MKYFYAENKLTKKGQGIGGIFNGPSIKEILEEGMINNLEAILSHSNDVAVAMIYLRNDNIDLNMTLKVHVILHYFSQYFELTNSTMRDTNGEFVETLHSSLHIDETNHGNKVVRKLGTQVHLKKAKNSLTSFNSKRAGISPAYDLTLRKKSCPRPSGLAHLFNKSYVLIYSIVYTFFTLHKFLQTESAAK